MMVLGLLGAWTAAAQDGKLPDVEPTAGWDTLPPIQTADMSRAEQKQLPDAVRQTILAEL